MNFCELQLINCNCLRNIIVYVCYIFEKKFISNIRVFCSTEVYIYVLSDLLSHVFTHILPQLNTISHNNALIHNRFITCVLRKTVLRVNNFFFPLQKITFSHTCK